MANIHILWYLAQNLLRIRNLSEKICRENRNISHFVLSKYYFSKIVPFYEVMWKNIVERGRPQIKMWRMSIACWIPMSTNTHSQYVLLIAFLLQHWSHERAHLLRYAYIACLVMTEDVLCEVRTAVEESLGHRTY